SHIAAEKTLIRDKLVNQAALEDVFHMMMVINPAIEFYLLDPEGAVLAYSAEPGKVKRTHVSLDPVQRWLAGNATLPVQGDDPRDSFRQKVFSAARIGTPEKTDGYLYIILGGEDYDNVVQTLAGSYILKVGAWMLLAVLVLSLLAGLLLFALLTGKLQRLTNAMRAFKAGDMPALAVVPHSGGDEIDRLTATFGDMARQINAQVETLKHTDNLRRELVANVSHDLRTPLATLHGYIETLLLKQDKLDSQQRREYLEIAILHCQRLNTLVSELFELARLDAQETRLNREPFSLPELVQDTVQKFQLAAREKHVTLAARFEPALPFVSADIGLVGRVLENLIENALRYTPRDGVIELVLSPALRGVAVQVSDTGCGIPDEELPRIFDRFYQLDKSRNLNPGSSGLGLAIAKRIVD
ncbi:MAG: HAMP domain-containing protein, partial [Gammaproteobacteria bacterium]|nr:HAMP domain-containing protein [Gammaproteobacteria bacterium]